MTAYGERVGVATRRPGRTQRIAVDETPLNAAQPDLDARFGWLLAMSRLHHHDAAFQDGRHFVEALGESGFAASRSLLSRWESGEIPISYEGMTAYERVLGLETGRLSSITGYLRAAVPGLRTRVLRPRLEPGSTAFADRLDDLVDKAEEGLALASDWIDLGWHLAAAPIVHLRRGTWETLAHRLVHQLPRTVKVAYRQYGTAATNLAGVERAQEFMVEAIADYVGVPGVQVVTNPIGLLDRLPTRSSARLVLEVVARPEPRMLHSMGVWLATQKVQRGDFTPQERSELGMTVLKLWRLDQGRAAEDLAELIAGLPDGIRSTLVEAAAKAGRKKLGYVVEHGEGLVAAQARDFSRELAEGARTRVPQEPAYDEDRMLTRLIREALFHRDSERRHLAALMITSSPFGSAVADELLLRLGASYPEWMRGRMATLVRYLSGEEHRMRMLAFFEDPSDDVAFPVLQGVGHLTFNAMSDQALRASLSKEWSTRERAKMYALGMSGSPALRAILKSSDAPEWQKTAAGWWLSQGPAIRS